MEAKYSKHRQRDVLPLHAELVAELGIWLKEVEVGEYLFPKLAGRKAWKLVKTDLESVGIPYRTDEGVADFHAAGRHTHITELLRNGATLPEASKLARHSTVQMTMKYCHIGIDDQAKALESHPVPPPEKCQGIVRKPGVVDGQNGSSTVSNRQRRRVSKAQKNLAKGEVSGTQCQRPAVADTNGHLAEDTGLEPAAPYGVPQFQ